MYWWNDRALAQKLLAGELTERHKLRYYVLMSLLMLLVYGIAVPTDLDTWHYIGISVEALTFIGGTVHCFICNNRNEGKDFIERMTVLSLPALVRSLVYVGIPVMLLLGAGVMVMTGQQALPRTIEPFLALPIYIYFYVRLGNTLKTMQQ